MAGLRSKGTKRIMIPHRLDAPVISATTCQTEFTVFIRGRPEESHEPDPDWEWNATNLEAFTNWFAGVQVVIERARDDQDGE